MREEIIGECRLILGDCADVIETLGEVDACVTDPPYGIGERMQGGTWGAADKYSDFRGWDIAPPRALLHGITRNIPAIVWGGNYFDLPVSRCWLAWDKINAVPTMADVELAWTNFDKPAKRLRLPVGKHEHGHPTEKPLALMTWCLSHLPESVRVVCDPFMGSGTTGVACVKRGLSFIGIEKHEPYFDIACKRIEAAYKQPDLFLERPAPPKQEALL
jgi:DNA modification methylase